MDKFVLAQKLYSRGYTPEQVRSIWNYAYQEQTLPVSSKHKKKRWQAVALEEVQVNPLEIDLSGGLGLKNNYF